MRGGGWDGKGGEGCSEEEGRCSESGLKSERPQTRFRTVSDPDRRRTVGSLPLVLGSGPCQTLRTLRLWQRRTLPVHPVSYHGFPHRSSLYQIRP